MKKLVYTLSFLVVCNLVIKAQNDAAPANRAGTPHPNDQAVKPNSSNSTSAPREGTAYPPSPPVNADGTSVTPDRSQQTAPAGNTQNPNEPVNGHPVDNSTSPNSAQTAPAGGNAAVTPAAGSDQPANGVAPNSTQTVPGEAPDRSRHAITEKGVPASRHKEVNSEKASNPPKAGGTKTTGKE